MKKTYLTPLVHPLEYQVDRAFCTSTTNSGSLEDTFDEPIE